MNSSMLINSAPLIYWRTIAWMFLRMRTYVPYIIRRAPGERIMCTSFLVGAHFVLNPKMALKAVCVMDSQSNGPVKGTITFTQEVTLLLLVYVASDV